MGFFRLALSEVAGKDDGSGVGVEGLAKRPARGGAAGLEDAGRLVEAAPDGRAAAVLPDDDRVGERAAVVDVIILGTSFDYR